MRQGFFWINEGNAKKGVKLMQRWLWITREMRRERKSNWYRGNFVLQGLFCITRYLRRERRSNWCRGNFVLRGKCEEKGGQIDTGVILYYEGNAKRKEMKLGEWIFLIEAKVIDTSVSLPLWNFFPQRGWKFLSKFRLG